MTTWKVIKRGAFFTARFKNENDQMVEVSLESFTREGAWMTRAEAERKAEQLALAAEAKRRANQPVVRTVAHEEMWRVDLGGTDDGNVKELCDAVDDPQVIRVIKADNFAVLSSGGGGAAGGSGSVRTQPLPNFAEFNRAFKEGGQMLVNGRPATVQRVGVEAGAGPCVAVVTWNDEGPAPTAAPIGEVAAVDQADKEASYLGYARQAVVRPGQAGLAGGEAVKMFDALGQDESLDAVYAGAARPLSEELKSAFEQVRSSIVKICEDLSREAGIPVGIIESKARDAAFDALDEIEAALVGQCVGSGLFDKSTHETMTALGLPVLPRPESAPVIGNMSQGDFERCMDSAVQMISDHERESRQALAPLLNVEKSGRVTFADDVEDENVIRQGGGWATFRRGGVWWIECTARRAGEHFARVSFSMHTGDDAVAGARFFDFRERNRSTTIESLLEATREERAAWVNR